jgi:hypothetical protein
MSPGAQNMKTGLDALGTSENESGRTKQENGTRRPPHRRKKMSIGAQNMKTETDALCTAENDSGRAKHEGETRRPRYRRK